MVLELDVVVILAFTAIRRRALMRIGCTISFIVGISPEAACIMWSLAVRVALRSSLSLLLFGEMLLTFVKMSVIIRLFLSLCVSVLQKVIMLLPVILGEFLTLPLLKALSCI